MGRNAILGHPVHFPSANLHLEGKGHFPSAHYRGVQALVHVGLGYGNIVLEPAGYLIPQGMDNAQHRVAVRHRIHQHADGNQIIDLLKGLVLQHHLPVNRIKVLGPPVDVVADMLLIQLGGKLLDNHANVFLAFRPLQANLLHQVLVPHRINVAQGQVLQLLLDGIHAQPVRQRRINIKGFPGNGHLPGFLLIFQGTHVMQAVRQLDEHHADVLAHGQDHLAQALGLGLLPVGKVQLVQLGHAVHQPGNLLPELPLDDFQGNIFAILHRIVQ